MDDTAKLTIKNWALDDRPREKLLQNGCRTLSDAELIAILIGSGNANESAVELSRRILLDVKNNLQLLGQKSATDLMRFNGIGEAKAVTIIAALELGRRRKEADVFKHTKITGSKDVFEYFYPIIGDLPHEEFWILLLDQAHQIILPYMVSTGGIASTVIDVRLVFKKAVEHRAVAMVLCHNHPSGNLTPSEADLAITKRLKQAGDIMEVKVLDHIIVGQKHYVSFVEENLLTAL